MANSKSNTATSGVFAGRKLAVSMLERMEDVDLGLADVCGLDLSIGTPHKQQRNELLKYFDKLCRAKRDKVIGFCEIMTDYISTCAAGGVPDAESYKAFLKGNALMLR